MGGDTKIEFSSEDVTFLIVVQEGLPHMLLLDVAKLKKKTVADITRVLNSYEISYYDLQYLDSVMEALLETGPCTNRIIN